MIARPTKTVRKQMEYWEHTLKIPFMFTAAKSRCYLDGESGSYMTDKNMLPMREIHNIKLVKDFIVNEGLYRNFEKVNKKEIKYFMYNANLRNIVPATKCYEIDLKSAYWEMAYKEGLLSLDLYKKAEEKDPDTGLPLISKKTRLACIGSLARRRSFYRFDGVKERRWKEPIPVTAHLWDHICLKISKIMQRAAKAAGRDFCFFWVDAAFVTTTSARDAVLKSFKKDGFKATVKPIIKIALSHERNHDVILVTTPEKEKHIPYSRKNRNIIK